MDWITNWLQGRDKIDASWWFAWPCIAYTQRWIPWLNAHQDELTVEIDFEQLSPEYLAFLRDTDADGPGHEE
jgi:hypothetical protein